MRSSLMYEKNKTICNYCCGFKIILFISFFLLISFPAYAVSTYSFTNVPGRGSHPERLTYADKKIRVDLSALSRESAIYRAILVPNRQGNTPHHTWKGKENSSVLVSSSDHPESYLQLRKPRFLTLDATEAVQKAVSEGKKELVLNVESFPFLGYPGKAGYVDEQTGEVVIRLDVTTDQPPVKQITHVQDISAYHENGDTLLTWTQAEPVADTNSITGSGFKALKEAVNNPREIRYRIYRSDMPISSGNIGQAKLIGEIDPLAIWNDEYWARQKKKEKIIPRFPIAPDTLGDYDTGIFVYNVQEEGAAYYAVTRVVDGAEDLSHFEVGRNTLNNAVRESPGRGMVLRWKVDQVDKFYYKKNVKRYYYVKWESPPNASFARPFNYLVAERSGLGKEAWPGNGHPVDVQLHQWGGWLHGGHLWWHRSMENSLWVVTNQRPYDWWTGYNENLWTLKPLKEGRVRLYTQKRIRSFVDHFVRLNWQVDADRIMVSGKSMGGAGASLWGIKKGDIFSHIFSMVGIHIPAESPRFTGSFAQVYGGDPTEDLQYGETSMTIWEYLDNTRWLRENVAVDTPHITLSNGRNDSGIGWPQAWKFAQALIETKRPFTFRWSMQGHNTRPDFPGGGGVDFRKNQSVPAFTNGGLDQSLGSSPEAAPEKGRINYWYLWETRSVVDTDAAWEMTIFLPDKAPQDVTQVNITPRRLQTFQVQPEGTYDWTNTQNGEVVQEGTVTADQYGLITLRSVRITKARNRIAVTPSASGPDVTPPGKVTDIGIESRSNEALTLAWTAPGDDGAGGTAAAYEIRYSLAPITDKTWNQDTFVQTAPLPRQAGTRQSLPIAGLGVGETYYLAVRAIDDAGNMSQLSQVVQARIQNENTVVEVASVAELYEALADIAPYTTILLEDGVYELPRSINLGPAWTPSGSPLRNVVLKGRSGKSGTVVLKGPGMSQNKEPKILIRVRHSRDIALQDLTLKDAYFHLVQVQGEHDADGVRMSNCRFLDAGQELIKVTRNANIDRYADHGVVENSFLGFTDHARYSPNLYGGVYYTNGIDALGTSDWSIRNNIFQNIRAPHDNKHPPGIAGAAILMWHQSRNATVEKNTFFECDMGVIFGKTAGDTPDCEYGVIKNNFIYRKGPGDVGISVTKSRDVKVYHNTVLLNGTFPWTIEERRFKEGKDVRPSMIVNNITDGPIRQRDYGYAVMESNLTTASRDWFQDPGNGDLHLKSSATAAIDTGVSIAGVVEDIDDNSRPMGGGPDIGADEYTPGF